VITVPTGPWAYKLFDDKLPRVIGHRGAAAICPENTLVSFKQAIKDGADILEMDVRLTKDGQIVVIHDETVNRTTDGAGIVSELTLSELRQLDAGYRFPGTAAQPFPFRAGNIRIPTLAEVLRSFPDTSLMVELKGTSNQLVAAVVSMLATYGRLNDGSVLICGFKHKVLKQVRRAAPCLATACSVREITLAMIRSRLRVRRQKARSRIMLALQVPLQRSRVKIVTPRLIRYAHALGIEVHVWTIDDESEMHRLLDMGVDGIFTNNPALLRRVVGSRQNR
jgi:glycerophosphoryl diester phosphodiesterase